MYKIGSAIFTEVGPVNDFTGLSKSKVLIFLKKLHFYKGTKSMVCRASVLLYRVKCHYRDFLYLYRGRALDLFPVR